MYCEQLNNSFDEFLRYKWKLMKDSVAEWMTQITQLHSSNSSWGQITLFMCTLNGRRQRGSYACVRKMRCLHDIASRREVTERGDFLKMQKIHVKETSTVLAIFSNFINRKVYRLPTEWPINHLHYSRQSCMHTYGTQTCRSWDSSWACSKTQQQKYEQPYALH